MQFQRRWLWMAALLTPLVLATLIMRAYWMGEPEYQDLHASLKASYLRDVTDIARSSDAPRPNIVLIALDSLGYGDLGMHNHPLIRTENIDALALAGGSLTSYYTASSGDAPARAALLSGRYPPRLQLNGDVGQTGRLAHLLARLGSETHGIPEEEILLPEVLRAAGYNTFMVGKWALGIQPGHLPGDFGFREFVGTVSPHDTRPLQLGGNQRNSGQQAQEKMPPDEFSAFYTRQAVSFIREESGENPFFLYLAYNMPRAPFAVSERFAGRSSAGRYGDVLTELDHGIGQLLLTLQTSGALENTLVMVTAINGPEAAGNPAPFEGRRGSTREGGTRLPFVVYWQDVVEDIGPRGQPASAVDVFPTVLDYLRLPIPQDRTLDGISLRPLFEGRGERFSNRNIFYFDDSELSAVRRGSYKLHRRGDPDSRESDSKSFWLVNLEQDPRELHNLLAPTEDTGKRELKRSFSVTAELLESNPRGWQ